MQPPRSNEANDKRMRRLMRERKETLARWVLKLAAEVGSRRRGEIPVTLDQDMRAGETLIVRVPEVFTGRV